METLDLIIGTPPCYASTATELKDRLKPEEASYLCGLIDADGHIGIRQHEDKHHKRIRQELKVNVDITHPMIIDLCNKYGGVWHYDAKDKGKMKSGKPYKPSYEWVWNHTMIRLYFPQMLPYFKLKKDQAEIIIKALECCGKGRATIDRDRNLLTEYRKQLIELHHKPYPLDKAKYEHLKIYNVTANPKCPKCDSRTYKGGTRITNQGKFKLFQCVACDFRFKIKVEN